MNRAPVIWRRAERWDRWYRRAFPAYFVFLFCVNHLPGLKLLAVKGDDKVAHFCAFGLLAFLAWRFAETFERPLRAGFVWLAAALLVAYAALDEWTQQYTLRGTDLADFVADALGVVATLALLEMMRRRKKNRATEFAPIGYRR